MKWLWRSLITWTEKQPTASEESPTAVCCACNRVRVNGHWFATNVPVQGKRRYTYCPQCFGIVPSGAGGAARKAS